MILHYIAESKSQNKPENKHTVCIINKQSRFKHGVNTIRRRERSNENKHITVPPAPLLVLEHRFQYSLGYGQCKNKEQAESDYTEADCNSEQSVVEVHILIASQVGIAYSSEIIDSVIRYVLFSNAKERIYLNKSQGLTPENKPSAVDIGILVTDDLFGI